MNKPQRTSADLQISIFPHENEQRSPRSAEVPGPRDLGPPGVPPIRGTPARTPGSRAAANTCDTCHHITIAVLWKGLRIDLEPSELTDLDEYHAIADKVPTYTLHPDRQVTYRGLIHIEADTRHPRHAEHRCHRTYGSHTPAPAPAPAPRLDDTPPF